jgi:hypothetical protein
MVRPIIGALAGLVITAIESSLLLNLVHFATRCR